MKVKALAVLVLLTALLSYLGIYWFEVSNGTSTGIAVGASIAFGSVVLVAIFFGARKLAEWPFDRALYKQLHEDSRQRIRAANEHPEKYRAYIAEVSRQQRERTYGEDSARLTRERLEREMYVPESRGERFRRLLDSLGALAGWAVILLIVWAIFFSAWFSDNAPDRRDTFSCDDLQSDLVYELCIDNEIELRRSGDL
jgi:hypothetical protein